MYISNVAPHSLVVNNAPPSESIDLENVEQEVKQERSIASYVAG